MNEKSEKIIKMLTLLEENAFLEKWYYFTFYPKGEAIGQGRGPKVDLYFNISKAGGWRVTHGDSTVLLQRESIVSLLVSKGVSVESVETAIEACVAAQAIWLQTRMAKVGQIMGDFFVEGAVLQWREFENELLSLVRKYSTPTKGSAAPASKKRILSIAPPPTGT
jgi:hypothetical protein